VAELLEELPTERDRQLLMRFYLDGIDKQQLCHDLGLSPKHFDRVLMRARSRLRTIIERRAPHLALFPRITAFLLALGMSFTFWVRDFGSW
jgi:DNA-directed RNA polymerase specialized sigma24 family protein